MMKRNVNFHQTFSLLNPELETGMIDFQNLIDQIMFCGILCRFADRFRELSERTLRFCQKLVAHDKFNHIM